jgi:hypothetical protein
LRLKTFSFMLFIIIGLFLFGFSLSNKSSEDRINGKQIGNEIKDVLTLPDKIVIYSEGTQKELDKTDPRFTKVVKLTNGRFHNKLSTVQDIIDDDAINNIQKDGLGIEFVYLTEQDMSITGDGFQPFRYNKLYFQLTSQRYGKEQGSTVHTFQHSEKDHYTEYSRGPLKYSKELVTLVKGI